MARQRVIDGITRDLGGDATTQAVFGPATTIDGRTIIPVAETRYGFPSRRGMTVRPIAVIEVTADRVRVLPIPDIQAIMTRVFGFAAIAVVAGMLMSRRTRGWGGFTVRIGNIGRLGSHDIRSHPGR